MSSVFISLFFFLLLSPSRCEQSTECVQINHSSFDLEKIWQFHYLHILCSKCFEVHVGARIVFIKAIIRAVRSVVSVANIDERSKAKMSLITDTNAA